MKRKELLFVDDESAVLNTLHRTLRKLPYRKHFASSADEGLEIMKKHPIGIVISDQRMPGMNGTEFLQEVRNINPETVRVILSAYANRAGIDVAREKCDTHYIMRKPWRSEDLMFLLQGTMQALSDD